MAWPTMKNVAGRFLGVDRDGYVTGKVGAKFPAVFLGAAGAEVNQFGVQALTSASTGTQITAGGVTSIGSSADQTFILAPPIGGARKTIFCTSTSTGIRTVRLSTSLGGTFESTLGSSFRAYTLTNQGQALNLVGLSTSIWGVVNHGSTSAPTT